MSEALQVLEAAAVRDARGVAARPGAVAVRGDRIVTAGARAAVENVVRGTPHERVELGDVLILPGLVNAHAHLDLTAIGPRPFEGSFAGWAEAVMRARPRSDAEVASSVMKGLRASHAAGVGWIGDVAGDERAVLARAAAARTDFVPGTSWLECFGIGARATRGAERAVERLTVLRADPSVRSSGLSVQLQPHAPYSAGIAVYHAAAAAGRPSTHLAETEEELEFVADATGAFAELLRRIDRWDDSIRGAGSSPVEHLADVLARAPWVVAHGNYLTPTDIARLSRTSVSVAYCPIASEYFGHRHHPYRALLSAGVNVCLGTDSILCQPPEEPQPLGIWPQMRRLFLRDDADPSMLLGMATVNGALALGLEPFAATLTPGAPARLIAVPCDPYDPLDPLAQALRDRAARPVPLFA